VIAQRTDAQLAGAAAKRVERWRRIAHEAAQQSRRLRPPQIDEAVKLKMVLGMEAGTRLLLNENEREKKIREALSEAAQPVIFAAGPEGGWTDEEFSQFDAARWQSVSMGSTILRAETAVIAAMAAAAILLD
jgi:16S rRNA (uracil1498-N3)-methyltransferase